MIQPLLHHNGIEPVAAGEIIALKSILHENPAGDIAAQPAVAIHIDRLATLQLVQPLPQLIQREIDRALDMPVLILCRRARIQQNYAAVAR